MKTARYTVLLFFLLFLLGAIPVRASQEPDPVSPGQELRWKLLEEGMEFAQLSFTSPQENGFARILIVRVLRFDTSKYDFALHCAHWEDKKALPLKEWVQRKQLLAAINASMFDRDGITSTGYMRRGQHINNGRIVRRYGSFFVSGPRQAGLPRAAILDREHDDWERLLPLYDIAIQNFRLMGRNGDQLWPRNGPRHAVACAAEDKEGRILFLHCSQPVSVYEFVEALKAHPTLHLRSAMYMEGGKEASLFLKIPALSAHWEGKNAANYMISSFSGDIPLPNILGVVRR